MQSANGMFKKVGSKGEARAVVVTLVTATAHSRLFSTGWALFSVFTETDSSSPPPHGPPRHPAASPREQTRVHVARARSVIGVRGLPPAARGPASARRILTAGTGAQATAVLARRSRWPQGEIFFAGHGAPARVWADPRGVDRGRRPAAARRPSVHMLLAICGRSALQLGGAAATPVGHGPQSPRLSFALRAPEVRPQEELPSIALFIYLTKWRASFVQGVENISWVTERMRNQGC